MTILRLLIVFQFAILTLFPAVVHGQTHRGKELTHVSLVADVDAVVPGQPFTVGLLIEPIEGWYTYWRYAGDAGLPTVLDWKDNDAVVFGEKQWPVPKKKTEAGVLQVYAYPGRVLLMTEVTPSEGLAVGDSLKLEANASWLVCEVECVEGAAELSLELPIAAESNSANAELFDEFRQRLPSSGPVPYELDWKKEGKDLVLTVADAESVEFFPMPGDDVVIGHPEVVDLDEGMAVRIPVQYGDVERLDGVLVVDGEAWSVDKEAAIAESEDSGVDEITAPRGFSGATLLRFLLFGFIGGILLNLMPCVLPVISLKIFGFIKQAEDSPARILRLGLMFTLGVFVWFAALAVVVAILQSGGAEIGWAFQFQNPWFIFVMSVLVFVFALNLFGVFEIFLPGSANAKVAGLAQREGYLGAFSHGVLATILATPCSAPFLGPALGFAFSQSTLIVFVMFMAVAAGLSAPVLLLSANPGWMRFLPKPGGWMEQLKKFMGFLLLATLLWLLWVLGHQGNIATIIWTGAFLLLLALACWIYGMISGPSAKSRSKVVGWILIIGLVLGGFVYFVQGKVAASFNAESRAPTESFTEQYEEAMASDKTVFVDFTAEWCLTCKVNEMTVIKTPEVEAAMEKYNVQLLIADWTNSDPDITAVLKKHDRAGVPFYIIYPANDRDNPIVLPEVITKKLLIDNFEKAATAG